MFIQLVVVVAFSLTIQYQKWIRKAKSRSRVTYAINRSTHLVHCQTMQVQSIRTMEYREIN